MDGAMTPSTGMLAAMVVVVLVVGTVQDQVPETQGLYFGGSAVVNHGMVMLDRIMNTTSTALLCTAPASDCCATAGSGDWFSPSGSVVTTSTSSVTYQVKGSFFVELRRSSGGVEGIYRCDIPLSAGAAHTSFYVGLYLAGSGFVSIDALQFSLTSALTADPPVFTLTCVSTGGPATTVTWTRDGAAARKRDGGAATGDTSQTVTSMLTATYVNTLTVTGRLPGNYQCSVTNDRSTAVRAIRVEGGVAPSGVSAAQDGTTITVTWIPPSPIPSAGYVVFYSTTGDEGSVSVSSGSDSQAVITGRQADYEYTVSVVALSAHLPSALTAVAAVRSVTYIELNGRVLPNNSLVEETDIVADAAMTLRCVTPRTDCCSDADIATSQWYHPDGSNVCASGAECKMRRFVRLSSGQGEPLGYVALVRVISGNLASSNQGIYRESTGNLQGIYRVSTGNLQGIYRCTVPKPGTAANPSTISYYIGIYNHGNGALLPIIDAIQFAVVSSSPVQFTLTCTSTGGPATSVTWTRDGVTVPYDTTHALSQTVVDTLTAQYNNTLTVSVVEGGSYQCTVSNILSVVRSAVLTGPVPSTPTAVSVSEATGSSVRVTWTAPTGNAELLGYLVSFERLTGRGCDSLHHDAYGVNNITIDYTVMGLSGLSTYTIGVAAVSIFGSSKVVPSDTIDTLPSPPTGPPTDVSTATNGNSITVYWSSVPCLQRNSQITGYVVRYTEVTSSRATSTDFNVNGGSATSASIDGLQRYTRYSFEVAAIGAGKMGVFSGPVTANTTGGAGGVNGGDIAGGIIAAILVVIIVAGIPVLIVWLVHRHRISLQKGSKNEVLGNQPQDPKITYKRCAAYKATAQPVEEENHYYEAIPLPGLSLPPVRGSSPTSSSQTSEYVDMEPDSTIQVHRAVVSVQARSTAPSHSPPQELGGGEHHYEPMCDPAESMTATPTSVRVTWKQKI